MVLVVFMGSINGCCVSEHSSVVGITLLRIRGNSTLETSRRTLGFTFSSQMILLYSYGSQFDLLSFHVKMLVNFVNFLSVRTER